MKKLFWAAFIGAGSLLGGPCTTAGLDTYTVSGFTCTLDGFTFKDFLFAVPASSGLTPITAAAITVLPGINHTPSGDSLGMSFTSPGFNITAGQSVTYNIRYNVDPQPDVIIEADDTLNANSPVSPGTADILTRLCIGGQWLGTTPSCDVTGGFQTLTVFHHGTPTDIKLTDSLTFGAVNRIGYDNYISLNGGPTGGGGSSEITGLGNATLDSPEPATIGLFLAGAALLTMCGLRTKTGQVLDKLRF
jgi:hypothetical protein